MEVAVSRENKQQETKRKLDAELDRQLENTFPASDALKISLPRRDEDSASRRDSDAEGGHRGSK
jgi:hypothetical protein